MIQCETHQNSHSIPNFPSLFQERHEYCRLLQELSAEQAKLIEQGQYNDLVELLIKKQTVIDALQSLSNGPPSLIEEWKRHREHLKPITRSQCEQLLEQTEILMKTLMSTEEQSTNQLRNRRDDTQRKISAVTQTVQLNQAYEQEDTPTNHIDLNR